MQTNYKLLLCSIPEEKEKELQNVEAYQNTVIRSIVKKAVADENMDFIDQLLKNDFIKQYKTLILSEIAKKEFFFPLVEKMLQEEDWEQDELTSILSSLSLSYSPSAKIAFLKKGAFNLEKEHSTWQEDLLKTAATTEFNIELVKYILEYILKYDKLDVFRYVASISFYIIIENYYVGNSKKLWQKKLRLQVATSISSYNRKVLFFYYFTFP